MENEYLEMFEALTMAVIVLAQHLPKPTREHLRAELLTAGATRPGKRQEFIVMIAAQI